VEETKFLTMENTRKTYSRMYVSRGVLAEKRDAGFNATSLP
jgi:hypothetical protein